MESLSHDFLLPSERRHRKAAVLCDASAPLISPVVNDHIGQRHRRNSGRAQPQVATGDFSVPIGFAAHVEADRSRPRVIERPVGFGARATSLDADRRGYRRLRRVQASASTAGLQVSCLKRSLHAALSNRQELHHRSDKLHRDGIAAFDTDWQDENDSG